MRFGVVCDVEGKTYLENGMTIEGEGLTYCFYVKSIDDTVLTQVRIISKVDDPDQYFYHKSPIQPDGTYTVNVGYEEHIRAKLIQELQTLEGILALLGNIKRVYWNKPIYEYYPETTEEHARFDVIPPFFFHHELVPDQPRLIESQHLIRLLGQTKVFHPLAVPMAFYREAKAEYSAARYISAFFNSYFIIEGLFGNRQWRERDVCRELVNSPVFSGFVKELLDEVATNDDPLQGMTKAQLEEELKARDQPYTVEGLVRLIVKKRGELHHFTVGSSKAQGSPLNNLDYKRIAVMTFGFASNALLHFLEEKEKQIKSASVDTSS